ncbi:MAG: hypothetical protein OXP66_06145 [Candidatus Tectomicrobia bacterium]|nr:hypothetical protein [Candidatus Tectomicrobia bacterium]
MDAAVVFDVGRAWLDEKGEETGRPGFVQKPGFGKGAAVEIINEGQAELVPCHAVLLRC